MSHSCSAFCIQSLLCHLLMPGKGAKGHIKLIISVLAGNIFFLVFVCFFFFNPQKYLTQLLFLLSLYSIMSFFLIKPWEVCVIRALYCILIITLTA